jgi:hypothetical protein
MTYRDPYSDRVSNPDPTYTAAPSDAGWSRGGIVGATGQGGGSPAGAPTGIAR